MEWIKEKISKLISEKNITKGRIGIFIVVTIILISSLCYISNVIEKKNASETIECIKLENFSVGMELHNKNKSNSKYVRYLNEQVESYAIQLYNVYIIDSEKYDNYRKQFEFLIKLTDSKIVKENYDKVNEQQVFLDKINKAKQLQSENKYFEAYLEVDELDVTKCLVYSDLNNYKSELNTQMLNYVEKHIKTLSAVDAYLYLKDAPVNFERKVHEYKKKIIDEVNNNIKNMSKSEALVYLDEIRLKTDIKEIIEIREYIEEEAEEEAEEEDKKQESNKTKLSETQVISKMINTFKDRYYVGECYTNYIENYDNNSDETFKNGQIIQNKNIYIVVQATQIGHVVVADTGEIYEAKLDNWDENGKVYSLSKTSINIYN